MLDGGYGPSPCWRSLSICVSTCCSDACRPEIGIDPAVHLSSKSDRRCEYPPPDGCNGGENDDLALFQTSMKVWKLGGRFSFGDDAEALVVGTLPALFASVTR